MSPLTHPLSLLTSFKLIRQPPSPHIFDLPAEVLLAILSSTSDHYTFCSLLLTHPIFNELPRAYPHTITAFIATSLFGGSQLPLIYTFLHSTVDGSYTTIPPPPAPLTSIPDLFALRQALDHAVANYTTRANQCSDSWLLLNPTATTTPSFITSVDARSIATIERCFIRLYTIAMVLLYHPVTNIRDRVRPRRDLRAERNREMFEGFFGDVPRGELRFLRSCLARVAFKESGLFMIMPRGVHWRYVHVCVRSARDLIMWDYDFGVEEGLL